MATLQDYFYLNRAGRYSAPIDNNARLPIIYGDLTDGTDGAWVLPCIKTSTFVYCFAGHAVQTVAQGNAVSIYADGVLVNPANYTFNASNNFESAGNIATITFTADQGNAQITARGKGVYSGALMENIIDIINDFLTVQNSFASTLFDATSKATARAIFTAQGYNAAGVICEDQPIWEILQNMIGSFYGSAYLNGDKALVLEIDNGGISQYGQAGIISRSDLGAVTAKQRLINLINLCPGSYAYDYGRGDFRSHSTGATTQDAISQSLFGFQMPAQPYRFYWCRDLATVETIQAIIVAKFKNPLWEVELDDLSLKRIGADVGDVLAASVDTILDADGNPYLNQLLRVKGITQYAAKRRFQLLDTGYFLTVGRMADGSYIADGSNRAGNDRDTTIY